MFILYVLLALFIWYISTLNIRKIYLSLKLPGPFPLPFIGSALYFINKKPSEIWKLCEKLERTYGLVFGFWLGSEYGIILSDPKITEEFLSSSKFIEKSETYKYLKPWLNEGLLLSTGSKWFQRRKILTPAFHFKILERYVDIFNRQSSVFVEVLSKFKKTDKVDLYPLIGLCTLDVICEAAMGIELNSQRNQNTEYVKAVHTMNHVIHLRIFGILLRQEIFFRFSRLYKQQKEALSVLHGFTNNVIQERRKKLLTQINAGNDIGEEKTFLDILLQGRIDDKPLSDLDIREEVDTFMFEGHDTTSSALIFCFYSIAKHPEVQQKCFQEIRDIIGDDCTKPVSFSDLNNFSYLDLVIKETLRLFPSVPIFARVVTEEFTAGKFTFPKGASLGISPVSFQINPKLFPNPHEFKPERFVDEKVNFSYLPFSAGPRNCIGQKFAMLEVKTLVTKVLRHFEISLADDSLQTPTLTGELVTKPEETINFHFKPRLYK